MSTGRHLTRRRLIAVGGGVALTGMAGCSGAEESDAPPDGGSTPGTAAGASGTATGEEISSTSSQTTAGYVVDSLSDYRTVVDNPDEWVGEQIAANDVSYYDSYKEEYAGFRALYNNENVARPFMLKNVQPRDNADTFRNGDRVSFEGTVEEIGEVRGTKIILVEDVSIL